MLPGRTRSVLLHVTRLITITLKSMAAQMKDATCCPIPDPEGWDSIMSLS